MSHYEVQNKYLIYRQGLKRSNQIWYRGRGGKGGAHRPMLIIIWRYARIKYYNKIGTPFPLRESTFIMPRGGGMKMLRGAPKYFLALKGGL
jgi:hypothetical protein